MEALNSLATSLDPRIPDACLPLLKSPGMSIRRKAARAIGSRWQQIPKERGQTFVDALKVNLNSDERALVNMSRRGIGLLQRTYDNDMFSRSKNGRWVVYERYGKPCLIIIKGSGQQRVTTLAIHACRGSTPAFLRRLLDRTANDPWIPPSSDNEAIKPSRRTDQPPLEPSQTAGKSECFTHLECDSSFDREPIPHPGALLRRTPGKPGPKKFPISRRSSLAWAGKSLGSQQMGR